MINGSDNIHDALEKLAAEDHKGRYMAGGAAVGAGLGLATIPFEVGGNIRDTVLSLGEAEGFDDVRARNLLKPPGRLDGLRALGRSTDVRKAVEDMDGDAVSRWAREESGSLSKGIQRAFGGNKGETAVRALIGVAGGAGLGALVHRLAKKHEKPDHS